MHDIQVKEGHYDFLQYMDEFRWISTYIQIKEIEKLKPSNIMEVGIGAGIFGNLIKFIGYKYTSVDFDRNLDPDVVASVLSLPFDENTFDVSVSFQVLEHLEYSNFVPALKELRRVSQKERNYIITRYKKSLDV